MHAHSVSIPQTIREFRLGCSEWENEVLALFNDVDRFLTTDWLGEAGPTATATADVAGLKGLVEQQTEVLTALVNALTSPSAASDSMNEFDQRKNGQSTSEVDPFARLQQAVAAASEAS